MSYHIHTTPGIILKRSPFGEANVLLFVLTYDLGLIMASAKSVRVSASKLRGALQEYSDVSLSCIKGKNGWKITNVVESGNYYFNLPKHAHRVLAQISYILLKMIPGEAPHKAVYKIVKSGLDNLSGVTNESVSSFEILIMLRILKELGYVVVDSVTEVFLENNEDWSSPLYDKITENKTSVVSLINKALKESQL